MKLSTSPRKPPIFDAVSVLLVVFLLNLSNVEARKVRVLNYFKYSSMSCRAHSASLTDFGGVGDGSTLNTEAFKVAIAHLSQFESNGGSQLFVPPGRWLTAASISPAISHFISTGMLFFLLLRLASPFYIVDYENLQGT